MTFLRFGFGTFAGAIVGGTVAASQSPNGGGVACAAPLLEKKYQFISSAEKNRNESGVTAPTLDEIMPKKQDGAFDLPRLVVIGGSYCGSRVSAFVDSVFDVTLIDTKNFMELMSGLPPIICKPWDEQQHMDSCRMIQMVHRYYLKNANVVTSHVKDVTDHDVVLSDGTRIEYDALILALGEKRPFPFSTEQRTLGGRIAELKKFNEFLQTRKKVAIVGGGPLGCAVAGELASSQPDKEVHLFHSRSELLPKHPRAGRDHALNSMLKTNPNLQIHLGTRVDSIDTTSGSSASGVSSDSSEEGRPWWKFWSSANSAGNYGSGDDCLYRLKTTEFELQRPITTSVVHRIYFGVGETEFAQDDPQVIGNGTFEGFDYVFALTGSTPRTELSKSSFLKSHFTRDGHIRASTMMQLLDHPNVFAIGKCNNFPWVKSHANSEIQARLVFKIWSELLTKRNEILLDAETFGIQPSRMAVPRQVLRLSDTNGVGSTPWGGAVTGKPAVSEFIQDIRYWSKDFQKPKFFKRMNAEELRPKFDRWIAAEVTDPTDFAF